MNGGEKWLRGPSLVGVGRWMASGGRYAAGRLTYVEWASPGTFADERCSGAMSRGGAA